MKSKSTFFTLLLLLILSACQNSPENQSSNNLVTTAQPTNEAPYMLESVKSECRHAETARTLEPFKRIEPNMSFNDVCTLIGWPDEDIGSGLYIFVYHLEDDSQVAIVFAYYDEPIFKIHHQMPDGTEELLIQSNQNEPSTTSKPIPTLRTPTMTPASIINKTTEILPTPTILATPTLAPTVTHLQKIEDLPVEAAYFELSNDGKLFAAVDLNTGILRIFDTDNWNLKWEIDEQNRGMTGYQLDFSPDGNLLAGGGNEQDVYIWDMDTGMTKHVFYEPYDTVNSVSFSTESRFLAASSPETYSSNYRIMVWDAETGELIDQFPAGDYGWYVTDSTFLPNKADSIAITSINFSMPEEFDEDDKVGGLYIWNTTSQQLQEVFTGTIGSRIGVSPNGQFVAAYFDGYLRVWDIENEAETINIPMEEVQEPLEIVITDKGIIASLDSNEKLTLWNVKGELLATMVSDKLITDIAFTPNEKLVIAYLLEGNPIELWQITD
jgi:WD40 repeat protein